MKKRELKEVIKKSVLEMARTKGTGHQVKITPEGEKAVKEALKSDAIPMGLGPRHLHILGWLYKNKNKARVQKIDYAEENNFTQQQVNGYFNQLVEKGLAEYITYQPTHPQSGPTITPQASKILKDLGIDLDNENESIKEIVMNRLIERYYSNPVITPPKRKTDIEPGKTPKRRTIEPPKEAPKTNPKFSLKEDNIVKKILDRFNNIKYNNEFNN